MITQDELDNMKLQQIKDLLGSGISGSEYKLVMKEYIKRKKQKVYGY